MTVVLLHLLLAFRYRTATWYLVPFFSGSQAVILFFVLSGYVLSLPFWAGKRVPYTTYALARFTRIYLPFFVAATLSILGAAFVRQHPLHLSRWFDDTWQSPITVSTVLDQYDMWPLPRFNTALWSLRYELQASLLLPPLMLLARRVNVLVLTGVVLALALHDTEALGQYFGWHFLNRTFCVLSIFLLGACAARYQTLLVDFLKKDALSRWLVFLVSFFLYNTSLATPATDGQWFPCAAGSLGLILTGISSRTAAKLLDSPPCAYLGRISYSLYLTHSIVLFGLTYLLHGRVPVLALCAAILVVSLAVAHLFYKLVDTPGIRLSRKVMAAHAQPSAPHRTALPTIHEVVTHERLAPVRRDVHIPAA